MTGSRFWLLRWWEAIEEAEAGLVMSRPLGWMIVGASSFERALAYARPPAAPTREADPLPGGHFGSPGGYCIGHPAYDPSPADLELAELVLNGGRLVPPELLDAAMAARLIGPPPVPGWWSPADGSDVRPCTVS